MGRACRWEALGRAHPGGALWDERVGVEPGGARTPRWGAVGRSDRARGGRGRPGLAIRLRRGGAAGAHACPLVVETPFEEPSDT